METVEIHDGDACFVFRSDGSTEMMFPEGKEGLDTQIEYGSPTANAMLIALFLSDENEELRARVWKEFAEGPE